MDGVPPPAASGGGSGGSGQGGPESMRCLGIDYGERRIGLSFGDDLGVATPLPALTQGTPEDRRAQIETIARRRRITDLIVGHPLNMDGSAGDMARQVEAFATSLGAKLGLPVHLVDERLTSYEAEQATPSRRRRAVRRSGVIDSRAACLILQDFLDQRLPPPVASPEV